MEKRGPLGEWSFETGVKDILVILYLFYESFFFVVFFMSPIYSSKLFTFSFYINFLPGTP